jgi:hypothetical protein
MQALTKVASFSPNQQAQPAIAVSLALPLAPVLARVSFSARASYSKIKATRAEHSLLRRVTMFILRAHPIRSTYRMDIAGTFTMVVRVLRWFLEGVLADYLRVIPAEREITKL